jgi:hypothetical protein
LPSSFYSRASRLSSGLLGRESPSPQSDVVRILLGDERPWPSAAFSEGASCLRGSHGIFSGCPYPCLRSIVFRAFSPGFGLPARRLRRCPFRIGVASSGLQQCRLCAFALRSDSACLRELPVVRQGHHVNGDAVLSESPDSLDLPNLLCGAFERFIRVHPPLSAPVRPPRSGPFFVTPSRSHLRKKRLPKTHSLIDIRTFDGHREFANPE